MHIINFPKKFIDAYLCHCRGTSLIRNRHPVGPYSSPMPRVLRGFRGVGHFLISEVPLYGGKPQGGALLIISEVIRFRSRQSVLSVPDWPIILSGVIYFYSNTMQALH